MSYYRYLLDLRHQLDLDDDMRFVFESGPKSDQPYQVDMNVVGDLFRVSDLVLMPSHREGFGMPVLEAGLDGIPVVCTQDVPAAVEIGEGDVIIFDTETEPLMLAARIIKWMEGSPQYRFRQRVRREYTWEAIFNHQILPLMEDTK
jgi:glycosyltransferase involved in cell wall biosynthesis